jgi:protein involved in polysaccharide export with SLBB domain
MKVHDLVEMAAGYTNEAYTERTTLIRTHPDLTRSILRFNLRMAMDQIAEDDLDLQELDEIRVSSVWEIRDRHTVTISGSVRKPGSYEYLDGMTLMDLVFQAGGLSEAANKLEAEVARVDSTTIATIQAARIIKAPISGDYAVGGADPSMPLQRWDQVSIRQIPDWQLQHNVVLTGEVMYPGTYALQTKDERLSSLIARAGGLKATAYPHAGSFVRKKDGVGRLAVDFDAVIKHGNKKQDLVLEDGDAINIRASRNG